MSGLISKTGTHGGARPNSGGCRPGAGRKPRADSAAAPRRAVAGVPLVDEPRWYCVYTLHAEELTADIAIRLAGFTVFAPSVFKPARPARRCFGMLRPALPPRIEPLFRRYLFTRFARGSLDWRSIRGLAGVEEVVGVGGVPTAVPEAAIDAIRGLCAPNGCIYPPDVELADEGVRPARLVDGVRARLVDGPMGDLSGICVWSDHRRVRLLMEILGRSVEVTVPRGQVRQVA